MCHVRKHSPYELFACLFALWQIAWSWDASTLLFENNKLEGVQLKSRVALSGARDCCQYFPPRTSRKPRLHVRQASALPRRIERDAMTPKAMPLLKATC